MGRANTLKDRHIFQHWQGLPQLFNALKNQDFSSFCHGTTPET